MSLLCDPGSELRLGGRKRKAKIIMEGQRKIKYMSKVRLCRIPHVYLVPEKLVQGNTRRQAHIHLQCVRNSSTRHLL